MTTDRIERVLVNQKKVFFMNIAMTVFVALSAIVSTTAAIL